MKKISFIWALLVASPPHYSLAAPPDGAWQGTVIQKVTGQRTTPRSAVLRGAKGEVRMSLSIDGNGMIVDYRMVQSSGEPILDREADLIIMRVGSFEPPPDRRATQITVPIRW